jgi:tRNA threonylcarbamoyladenosine biosynthesis protein TsaE
MPLPHFKFQKTTYSFAGTQKIARQIGASIQEPAVIALIGDLGSGKTTFVQGLARGLEIPQAYYITSPTFTLINEYPGRLALFHVDLYRLPGPVVAEEIGLDEILSGDGVCIIEWADKLPPDYLCDHLSIKFEILDDEVRNMDIFAYGQNWNDLIKALSE